LDGDAGLEARCLPVPILGNNVGSNGANAEMLPLSMLSLLLLLEVDADPLQVLRRHVGRDPSPEDILRRRPSVGVVIGISIDVAVDVATHVQIQWGILHNGGCYHEDGTGHDLLLQNRLDGPVLRLIVQDGLGRVTLMGITRLWDVARLAIRLRVHGVARIIEILEDGRVSMVIGGDDADERVDASDWEDDDAIDLLQCQLIANARDVAERSHGDPPTDL
jgi:hypothetical protein